MKVLRRIGLWLVDRLALEPIVRVMRTHKVPASVAGKKGWMYVFGSAILAMFLVQLVTGVALVTKYVPSPAAAHETLIHLNEQVTLGGFLRALHFYGASAMVALVLIHMARVFLTGSYKFPREMSWISGVVLLVSTFAMAFTGQLLRWDETGVWAVMVAAKFAVRVPLLGEYLANLILAGDTVGATTLSRFYAFHVFILPGIIILLVGLHLWLVFHNGISEPPKAGRKVDPATYRAFYARLKAKGLPYFPYGTWKEALVALLATVVVFTLAAVFGPKGPGLAPDPTQLYVEPMPDWFLIWYFALLWVKSRGLETLVMVYAPILVFFGLLVFPLLANKGERALSRRPWAVIVVLTAVVAFGWLTYLGLRAPWLPATESEPLSQQELGTSDPRVLAGAQVFHERGCQLCHVVLGRGGAFGPDLTDVARRLSPEEITVRTVMGIGDMPAYRGILEAEELDHILGFLRALKPADPGRPGRPMEWVVPPPPRAGPRHPTGESI